jgi:MoaA/NifB/PqqE/SkfB family radical SAM enzyme
MHNPIDLLKRQLSLTTHRIYSLPIIVLMPHSRCNCRCVMCDIWKANQSGQELSRGDLARHLEALRKFNVRWVVLSGGEALMHSNLWVLCELLKGLPAKISLLSTGLLLQRHVSEIVRWCDEVIVSLDGSREIHGGIRRIPRAYDRLAEGVAALKTLDPDFRVTARCTLQRANYFDLPNIIQAAHELDLDQISFLAADVSTTAFNRPQPWDGDRVAEIALDPAETARFVRLVEQTIEESAVDFASNFIAESPAKLRQLPGYFAALNGDQDFPGTVCNAPWVSAVVEADGTVRPCFFHRSLGNLHERPLEEILNAERAIAFRRTLDVNQDPICRKCVCTLHVGLRGPS